MGNAATFIAACWRGRVVRQTYLGMRRARSSLRVQTAWRGWMGRRKTGQAPGPPLARREITNRLLTASRAESGFVDLAGSFLDAGNLRKLCVFVAGARHGQLQGLDISLTGLDPEKLESICVALRAQCS